MYWNILSIHLANVARYVVFIVGKIRTISLLRVSIPLAREETFPAYRLEAQAQTAYAGEQIDESKFCF